MPAPGPPPPNLLILPGPPTYPVLFYIIVSICHPPPPFHTLPSNKRGLISQLCSYWLQRQGGRDYGLGPPLGPPPSPCSEGWTGLSP